MEHHHLDKRAADIAAQGEGPLDDLLDTPAIARWLGVSTQWLEIGRYRGYGPTYLRLSPRRVRFRRRDVLAWLEARAHQATAEYSRRPSEAPSQNGRLADAAS